MLIAIKQFDIVVDVRQTRAMIKLLLTFACCFFIATPFTEAMAAPVVVKRTEIHISKSQSARLKDFLQVTQMIELTPLINDKDEVIAMEISRIDDKLFSDVLKAQVGDRFSKVKVFKNIAGKTTSETVSVVDMTEIASLYGSSHDVSRVEIDLKRKKAIIPMTYIID